MTVQATSLPETIEAARDDAVSCETTPSRCLYSHANEVATGNEAARDDAKASRAKPSRAANKHRCPSPTREQQRAKARRPRS
jgi:hypothetical protein